MDRWNSPKDQLDAASALSATPDDLQILAHSEYGFVRVAVGGNPNTAPADILAMIPAELADSSNQELAEAIAGNPGADPDTLSRLGLVLSNQLGDRREDRVAFRAGVKFCDHSNAPLESIRDLLDPQRSCAKFRKVVGRETARQDVLELLREDPSSRVQRALRRRSGTSGGS